ncbi:TonB-dependent receptor [Gammaproteobacteria bacterium]|jgi:iron complex outermembrane receptor protein|nr:TonB-dependent receptor [Gammaproteobacteria bacterium]
MHIKLRLIYLILLSSFASSDLQIEELITTGTLLKNPEQDSSPVEVITEDDYKNFNISNIAEISKYISSSSGSHFQANTLDGVDQGMAAITLRGLDHSATLLLVNSKRQTFAGTPSNEGEGYIDINIIPEIALKQVEILKEGATSLYGSDAVAGVVNMITHTDFNGLKFQIGHQKTSNYNQNDSTMGILYGSQYNEGNYVLGINVLKRSPLSASEIPGIAELAISGLGRSFIISGDASLSTGIWAGDYSKGQKIPDPKCLANGGVLTNSTTCGFLYGNRFNVVNDEDHIKFYSNLNHQAENFLYELIFMSSQVNVNDNPQSPSYPALPFLSRMIQPGDGGNPFNVAVKWFGRPLGSEVASPNSPKEIKQYHLSQTMYLTLKDETDMELSFTKSDHSNDHFRPDIIDSRFLDSINGTTLGSSGADMVFWNLFDSSQNSQALIDYVRGAETSTKQAGLESLDLIFRSNLWTDYSLGYGVQVNKENLNISYDEISRAEFDENGKIIKTADLFFLGGGKNVSKSRNKYASFFEIEKKFIDSLDIRLAGRYEDFGNDSSFDPKLSFKFNPIDKVSIRASRSSSFTMPSMAQMFSSDINLGSVRDFNGNSPFVRQAQIGNPNLKPATSKNSNLGVIFNNINSKFSIDFWNIDYRNRIEVESSQAMLNLNPNGSSITRNSNGDLIGVTTTYFNEESTEVSGVDVSYETFINLERKGRVMFAIKGTSINKFLTPEIKDGDGEEHIQMVNRVGKFNYDADTHSLPKKRINAFINWNFRDYGFNLNARHVDGYSNERPINDLGLTYGYKNKVDSFLVFDFSASKLIKLNNGEMDLKFSIINIFDESAPRLYDAPDFSFDSRVHDPRGRIIGLNLEYRK